MVTVIDSMMGSGKTSWALQFMDENPDESFIYCTPFLDEVTRIQTQSSRRFYEPNNYNNKRKIDTFNDLLMDGRDICVMHCTFSNATDETIEYIRNGNYVLILDEVIDVLIDYNSVTNDNIKKGDIALLLNEGFISFNEYGKVTWLKQSYAESKYSDVERLARNGNLFYLDGSLFCYFFNHNRYCKSIVHHIDGIPTNNCANNLLWVTSNQHKQLHQLLKTDTAAYRHMVTQIKRENRWRS